FLPAPTFFIFLLKCYVHHPHLHSFPTRRSSDLNRSSATHRSPTRSCRPASNASSSFPRTSISPAPKWKSRSAGTMKTRSTRVGKDRKSTRLNSSHVEISYAVFCLKKKKKKTKNI